MDIHFAQKCIICTHSKANWSISSDSNKSREADTGLLSLNKSVCRSIQRELRKERSGKRERRKEKKSERSVLSPPLRLLSNTATDRGRERVRLSKRKSDIGGSPLTKYKAVASQQSQYSAQCVCAMYSVPQSCQLTKQGNSPSPSLLPQSLSY